MHHLRVTAVLGVEQWQDAPLGLRSHLCYTRQSSDAKNKTKQNIVLFHLPLAALGISKGDNGNGEKENERMKYIENRAVDGSFQWPPLLLVVASFLGKFHIYLLFVMSPP